MFLRDILVKENLGKTFSFVDGGKVSNIPHVICDHQGVITYTTKEGYPISNLKRILEQDKRYNYEVEMKLQNNESLAFRLCLKDKSSILVERKTLLQLQHELNNNKFIESREGELIASDYVWAVRTSTKEVN